MQVQKLKRYCEYKIFHSQLMWSLKLKSVLIIMLCLRVHIFFYFFRVIFPFGVFQTKTEAKESGTLVSYENEALLPNFHDVKALKIYVGQLHFSLSHLLLIVNVWGIIWTATVASYVQWGSEILTCSNFEWSIFFFF